MGIQEIGERRPLIDKIPYPSHPLLKYGFKSPLLLWRLGLGPVFGRLFMILTTKGRKSGLPRHTPLEYHIVNGRPHVVAAWPQSDWYRNIQTNPLVTVQTAAGSESMVARRLTADDELSALFDYAESHPTLRKIWEALSIDFSRESFLADKERFHILTFEPAAEPTPPPLTADLWWLWPAAAVAGLAAVWFFRRMWRMEPMIVVSRSD
jgi:deazaflavin-dependent oxidoreductase (nitroreductase family)